MITKETKATIVTEFGDNGTDTGKSEVQIAIFTKRIQELTGHLESHKKDNATRRGLIQLVSKRRRLLNYLQKNDINRYRQVIAALKLRK